jgi:hypothetical protein
MNVFFRSLPVDPHGNWLSAPARAVHQLVSLIKSHHTTKMNMVKPSKTQSKPSVPLIFTKLKGASL